MKLWDVNIWLYAFRKDSPFHGPARREIEETLASDGEWLFCPTIAASFLRIVTNPRVFRQPSTLDEAWDFVDCLESSGGARKVDLDDMSFGVFKHLCLASGATANAVPDALLAALAIRHGAEFVTADSGFSRYRGLKLSFLEPA